MTTVRPHIMLQGGVAEDAISLWRQAFPSLTATPPSGVAGLWEITVEDQRFTLFDSQQPHAFGPTPAWSFMVDVDDAEHVHDLGDILSAGGTVLMPADAYPFAEQFTWVEDRFGVSWQVRFGAK